MSKLTLKTEGDTHVVVIRRFAAAPEAVYRAHIDPVLIKKWMLGPDGWTMPVCINDAGPAAGSATSGRTARAAASPDGRVPGAKTLQPHRPRRADASARPDAGQPHRNDFAKTAPAR